MRTIAVHPSAELYGSDRMFLESVTAMGATALAVLPHDGPLVEALAERGIHHVILDFPILRKVELSSLRAVVRFLLRFLVAVPRLVGLLRRHQASAVYVSTVIAPVWIVAAKLAGCRVTCHVHESEASMRRVAAMALLSPLRLTDRVIAISKDTQAWVTSNAGSAVAEKVRVIYNGVPRPAADRADEGSAVPGPGRQLVVVGRLSERKGQDVAIRALALLRDRGYDVSLTLVGDCFPGYESVEVGLRELVNALALSQHVAFAGFQSEPLSFVRDADVALVPSRIEPFGLVAVEALMLGRPTIVTNVGGLREIVTDGRTGRVVPPDDPYALAEAVADLLDAPGIAAELGQAGRIDSVERFSLETYRKRLCEALA